MNVVSREQLKESVYAILECADLTVFTRSKLMQMLEEKYGVSEVGKNHTQTSMSEYRKVVKDLVREYRQSIIDDVPPQESMEPVGLV